MRRLIVMGAGGRDFHDFNVLYRDDPEVQVVAFTATQIPGIDDRIYPPSLPTINAVECDLVVTGTPFDLRRIIDSRRPVVHAAYELRVLGEPTLKQILEPFLR